MKANNIFTFTFSHAFALTLCTGALTACCGLSAQTADASAGPRQPPAESLHACRSAISGQDCSFSSPRGTVNGTCWAPEGKPLACKPKDAPTGHPNTSQQ